ncbi:alkene reductase [Undibacterium curvum]|uniref:alkene reductase n=1 Tax=Undibacterium curvum TaxID=2762294 RepID=UPI003D0FB4AF
MNLLLSSLQVGALHLPNRIVMSPLTRARATREHIPTPLMEQYYAQRATAGLIIAEATMISPHASAFISEPGLYNDDQTAAWRKITDAVHARGGRIVVQLWHPGRAAHSVLDHGVQPVSSSTRAIKEAVIHTPQGKLSYETPRALRDDEIPGIIEQFRQATRRALAAGFDGVQIHGAHGYLIDQFLRDGVNDRNGPYGGSIANRSRLLLEVVDAAIEEAGSERVSVRLSPLFGVGDMIDSAPDALVSYVAQELSKRYLSFLEIRHTVQNKPEEQALARLVRSHFSGVLMLNGRFDLISAQAALEDGYADAIVFGTPFIANPDLVNRIRCNAVWAKGDPTSYYVGGAEGYTDYPELEMASPTASETTERDVESRVS